MRQSRLFGMEMFQSKLEVHLWKFRVSLTPRFQTSKKALVDSDDFWLNTFYLYQSEISEASEVSICQD